MKFIEAISPDKATEQIQMAASLFQATLMAQPRSYRQARFVEHQTMKMLCYSSDASCSILEHFVALHLGLGWACFGIPPHSGPEAILVGPATQASQVMCSTIVIFQQKIPEQKIHLIGTCTASFTTSAEN